ncbi:MAG: hypothetical protein ACKOCB_00030 [Planctomycetia bacterium]
MDVARAYKLLRRTGLRGYDIEARTFRPWHGLWRYSVDFHHGCGGTAWMSREIIMLPNPANQCPHVIVHSFVHEAGHAQFLLLDITILLFVLPDLLRLSWYWPVAGIVVWQFVWREVVADIYSVRVLGVRNTWRGYAHFFRNMRRSRRR